MCVGGEYTYLIIKYQVDTLISLLLSIQDSHYRVVRKGGSKDAVAPLDFGGYHYFSIVVAPPARFSC